MYAHPYYTDRATRALVGHEQRVAHFCISSFSVECMLARFVDGFSRMTSIEVLDLAASTPCPTSHQAASADPTISLLAVQARRLRRITLANLSLRTPTSLDNLTHLDVQSSTIRQTDWLSFIAYCPRLEYLYLKHRRGSVGQPPEGPTFAFVENMALVAPRRVNLPALRNLKLELFLPHIASFLVRLVIPNATHISLDAVQERAEPSAAPALIAIRLMVTHDALASSIQAIHLVLGECFHISAWHTPDFSRDPLIRLTVPTRQTAKSAPEMLREAIRTFAPSSLAYLSLDTTWLHGIDETLCLELLRQNPTLVDLCVAGTHSVFPALAALCKRGAEEGMYFPVCKKLVALKLHSMSFAQTATVVLDAWSLRAATGLRLKELHLLDVVHYGSEIDDAIVERLKTLVDVLNITYNRGGLRRQPYATYRGPIHDQVEPMKL